MADMLTELVRPQEHTTEPMWVFPCLGLGLVAATGSIVATVLAGCAAVVVWILVARDGPVPPSAGRDRTPA